MSDACHRKSEASAELGGLAHQSAQSPSPKRRQVRWRATSIPFAWLLHMLALTCTFLVVPDLPCSNHAIVIEGPWIQLSRRGDGSDSAPDVPQRKCWAQSWVSARPSGSDTGPDVLRGARTIDQVS